MPIFEKKKQVAPKTLWQLLQHVATFGTATAIRQKKDGIFQDVSYLKLKNDAEALALSLGTTLPKGAHVLVLGRGGYPFLLSVLALSAAGLVPVLQNVEVGRDALADVIQRSGAAAVLYDPAFESEAQMLPVRISLDALDTLIGEGKERMAAGASLSLDAVTPEDTAAVFFTSGTTGQAKGTLLSHLNLCTAAVAAAAALRLREGNVFLSVLPQSHAFEWVWGLLSPLYAGAVVAFAEDLNHLTRNMQEVHPTHMVVLPMIAEALYNKILKNIAKYGTGAEVQRALLVSDVVMPVALRQSVKARLLAGERARFGGALSTVVVVGGSLSERVYKGLAQFGILPMQTFGVTESAGFVAIQTDGGYQGGAAGRAMPGSIVDIYSPDANGVGQIRCKGQHVMKGYLDSPELTEQALQGGWLYTDDLGFVDKKGLLHVVGRLQNVIEMASGGRLCPEQIEAMLCRESGVAEAFVMGLPNSDKGDYDLVALLRPVDAGEAADRPDTDTVTEHAVAAVNAALSHKRQIQCFAVQREEFPKTLTRRLDRTALSTLVLEKFKKQD